MAKLPSLDDLGLQFDRKSVQSSEHLASFSSVGRVEGDQTSLLRDRLPPISHNTISTLITTPHSHHPTLPSSLPSTSPIREHGVAQRSSTFTPNTGSDVPRQQQPPQPQTCPSSMRTTAVTSHPLTSTQPQSHFSQQQRPILSISELNTPTHFEMTSTGILLARREALSSSVHLSWELLADSLKSLDNTTALQENEYLAGISRALNDMRFPLPAAFITHQPIHSLFEAASGQHQRPPEQPPPAAPVAPISAKRTTTDRKMSVSSSSTTPTLLLRQNTVTQHDFPHGFPSPPASAGEPLPPVILKAPQPLSGPPSPAPSVNNEHTGSSRQSMDVDDDGHEAAVDAEDGFEGGGGGGGGRASGEEEDMRSRMGFGLSSNVSTSIGDHMLPVFVEPPFEVHGAIHSVDRLDMLAAASRVQQGLR
ncbi:hypothetical protein T439DRAFT_380718 [Meredithblackwellia eburnea MCA 4105]